MHFRIKNNHNQTSSYEALQKFTALHFQTGSNWDNPGLNFLI
jgi:hypothetical protein